MRLLSLRLIAFGHFRGETLDFPCDKGLFIIYGPNEAGKSTSLRALQGLLYGIPERTPDAFLHDMASLRVGGELLRSDGEKLVVVRRKGRKDTLQLPDGRAIPEDTIRSFLGSVDASTFFRVFGMNRHELVEGGRQLAQGKGDVGESLFVAGLAGADLKRALNSLDDEAVALFKPGGSTPAINTLTRLRLRPTSYREQEATS